ncbi:RNA polymerase sigma factor [Streptomyces niveus]|uniref:RNA polymerase sigma factor n=1 Tax=Streptomyces niveus TaxID=193462 RepID=UPI00114CF850|nr:sigma-70 family RNA polymerase sigma factor [Streptomyces niveus]
MSDSPEQERELASAELDREFADFFAEHKDNFLRIAAGRLRNLHDADEALMDAAVQMHRKWPRIKAHANSIALAHTILGAAVTDFYRRRARHTDREVPVPGPSYSAYADTPTVDDILALRGYDGLDRALATLAERAPMQAECVRLRYLGDKEFEEIAACLNITKGAAKTNVHLGLKKMHALMDLPDPGKGDS